MGTEHPTESGSAGSDAGEERPALGQPAGDPTDTSMGEPDIAGEHEDTAVDKKITSGTDGHRESESPEGLGGMDGA